MTDAVIIALIAVVPPTIVGMASLLQSLANHRKILDLDIKVDGRLSQLLAATNAQGRQDERDAKD